MTIKGTAFVNPGFIGIGNGFTTPTSRLHLHQPGSSVTSFVYTQWTNGTTGATATDGFRVGIAGNGFAHVQQNEDRPLLFFTAGVERMRIYDPTLGLGRIAIHRNGIPTTVPGAMLHIGDNFSPLGSAGHRTWMEVGTFYFQQTDNLYVGMKDETAVFGADANDAVICWGDNQTLPNPGGFRDNMRFIFTEPTSSGGPGSAQEGLEVMRMTGNGNIGVGNFYTTVSANYIAPQRRLHVFQSNPPNVPQFRISETLNANINQGEFCDFRVTGAGNLVIIPRGNGNDQNVGIHANNPGNTLEINSTAPNALGAGSSGLRFRDLQFGVSVPSAPQAGQGVLSVNANGDVVYITGSGGGTVTGAHNGTTLSTLNPNFVALGQNVGGAGGQLLSDREIPMNNFNIYFPVPTVQSAAGRNNIGIGTTSPVAKIDVVANNQSGPPLLPFAIAGNFTANNTFAPNNNNVVAVNAAANNPVNAPIQTLTGGLFTASSPSAGTTAGTQGVWGRAIAQGINVIGGRFEATGSNPASGGTNIGVSGVASNADINIGVRGQAAGGTTSYAGYFDGDVFRTGTDNFTSDVALKQNIQNITNASALVAQLQPKTFYFDTTAHPEIILNSRKQYGFIAQDVEPVLPELVTNNITLPIQDSLGNVLIPSNSYKGLNYQAFIALMMKALQEQQAHIEQQDSLLQVITTQVNSCCQSSARTGNNNASINEVELSDNQNIVLDQNVPNPFAEQTTISYFLPDNVKKAQMLFYNAEGKLINAVELPGRGKGQLNVFANDLSNGVYTYSLVADGQVIATKRMVKNK